MCTLTTKISLIKQSTRFRVMRWRLICKQYGADLQYIKGFHNILADALSRLNLTPSLTSEPDDTVLDEPLTVKLHEAFPFDKLLENAFPLRLKELEYEQGKDKNLLTKAHKSPTDYSISCFHGGRREHKLIIKNDKIVVPTKLQKRIVSWYHQMLCHPGETRTEATISQHFRWQRLREGVHNECGRCHTCQ